MAFGWVALLATRWKWEDFPRMIYDTRVNNNRITKWIQIVSLCGSSEKSNEGRDKIPFTFRKKSNPHS